MRLARKLFLLAAMAIAALAMTASTASAQIEVLHEDGGDHCDPVTVEAGHNVHGGCHIEFSSVVDIPLHAYIPAKTTISNCEVYLSGRVDEEGEGYVELIVLEPPHAGGVPCTREACDEMTGTPPHPDLLWPFHIREEGAGHEEVEAEFCLRANTTAEGSAGNWCDVHLPFQDEGAHQYEIGSSDPDGTGTEVFCENNPSPPAPPGYDGNHDILPFPISIEAHLRSDPAGEEDVEVIHF